MMTDKEFVEKYEAVLAREEAEEAENNNAAYRADCHRMNHKASRVTFSAAQVAMITTPTVTM